MIGDGSEPHFMHLPHEFFGDRIAGAFPDDRINAAVWAEGRSTPVNRGRLYNPFFYLCRIKDLQAIEAATDLVLLQLWLMI